MRWDEFVGIRLASGERRHGVVLDVDGDRAVVQVYEGTAGISTDGLRVRFTGAPVRVPVGPGWLGRVCGGRGDPIDGGPPVLSDRSADVGGHPVNPGPAGLRVRSCRVLARPQPDATVTTVSRRAPDRHAAA